MNRKAIIGFPGVETEHRSTVERKECLATHIGVESVAQRECGVKSEQHFKGLPVCLRVATKKVCALRDSSSQ